VAREILDVANVADGLAPADLLWTREQGDCSVLINEINAVVKDSLDVLCESMQTFFQKYYDGKEKTVFAVNPISVTGEGVGAINGIAERIASRLNHLTESVYPSLPYYEKPKFSSRISLLDMALAGREKTGLLQSILRKLGGKK
jgi:Tfp pilus assembly PilM family ATPase